MFWMLGLAGVGIALMKMVPWRFPPSHTTRVPVDDFVVGDLPMICVDTGERADGMVDFETDDSRFQWWMIILVFLGPVGWVLMALIHGLSRGPGRVGGALPMTREALDDHNQMAKISNRAWVVPIIGFVSGALVLMVSSRHWTYVFGTTLLMLGLVGGFAVLAAMAFLTSRNRVSVDLDATGRWVEIRNVHPDFAAEVNRKVRDDHRARKSGRVFENGPASGTNRLDL